MNKSEARVKLRVENTKVLPDVITLLNEGHSVTLPLRGYSMRPFLEDGRDSVILVAVDRERIKVGDVVLAEVRPKVFVLHRIIIIDGDSITLCGDGNIQSEQCKRSDISAIAKTFLRTAKKTPYSTDGYKWKIYSWMWTHLYPIRRYLLFIYRKAFNKKTNLA